MANSVDPDETPHSAASHLGLCCLLRPVCPNIYGKYGNNSWNNIEIFKFSSDDGHLDIGKGSKYQHYKGRVKYRLALQKTCQPLNGGGLEIPCSYLLFGPREKMGLIVQILISRFGN